MPEKRALNPALGYNRFSEILRDAEANTVSGAIGFCGYKQDAVGRRLLQRIVEVSLNPFIQQCADRHRQGTPALPADNARFVAGGMLFDGRTNRVIVTWRLWFRSLFEFCAQWGRILAIMTGAFFNNRTPRGPREKAALLFGVGLDEIRASGSDRRFLDFCRQGPITPLRNARQLIVECIEEAPSSAPDYCTYAKYPLFKLVNELPMTGRTWASFIGCHIKTAIQFVAASLYRPLIAILARDAAFHALIHTLNRAGHIGSVVITNSHYHVQPLWMRALPERKFETHMVWYSQNSIPFTYRFDGVRSYLPNHRHIEVDNIWVWTSGFGTYLRDRGALGIIKVVGPILWHLHEEPTHFKRTAGAIVIFDVTPFNPEFIERFGLPYNYYRTEIAKTFISEIIGARDSLSALSGKPIPILLKHKRSFSPQHDRTYLDFIGDAITQGTIQSVPTHTNLYNLISGALAVVVMPYSSPAYIAAELGIPALFFDPYLELIPTHEDIPGVRFVAGAENLRKALAEITPQDKAMP